MTVGLSAGGNRTVSLPLSPSPEQPVPKIANLAALQGFDASQNLMIQWNAFAGAGQTDIIQLKLLERGGAGSYSAPNKCANIQLLVTDTSHTIPAGTLRAGATYDLELSFSKTTHLRDANVAVPPGQANNHIPGYAEFTLFTKTTRTTIGTPPAEASLRFTDVFTEQLAGKLEVTMEISGTLASANAVGIVEGSSDFVTWTSTGIVIPKAALDAQGGVFVTQDPAWLTGTPGPHKFYRIVIP